MTAKSIPAADVFARWQADPAYAQAYDTRAAEFEIASAIIGARARSGLTQAELATRIGSSQSQIARLESGRSHPTVRTLERIAKATGSRLRLSLEAN
jgi:ribosome-binding protein aMBF1 (putative translation factor)